MKRFVIACCLFLSLTSTAAAGWIHIKAKLGQVLLAVAWQRSISTGEEQKAWPWADTAPVSKLHVPSLDQSMIVLEGTSGEAMAFGPAQMQIHRDAAQSGLVVIGGHRDSHLQFLEHLPLDATLNLQNKSGFITQYRVARTFIADSSKQQLSVQYGDSALILITCYPFNAMQTGGPLRYVVVAEPLETYL